MGFFDDIGKSISDASQQVAQKASGMAESARFNSAITEEKKKIVELYGEIGKKYFEMYENDDNLEGDLAEFVSAIKASKERIDEFELKVKELKGVRICPSCGGDVPAQSQFCTLCGSKMPEIEQPKSVEQGSAFCTGCGSKIPAGSKFCTACGKAVN